jgi:hypothetical protein
MRRHPDHYADGTPDHTEATQMTRLINEACAAIADAPLGNYAGASAARPGASVAEDLYEEELEDTENVP